MTWKTWAAALSLGAALTAAPQASNAFDRKDGTAGAGNITDPSMDIVDLYAWMEPTSANRVYLVLTVFPDADKMTSRFSNTNIYVFHTNARTAWNDTAQSTEIPIICKFDSNMPTQNFECWAKDEYVKGRVNAAGQTSRNGALTVFAGPRNDPFFMNETALNNAMTGTNGIQTVMAGTKDVAGCHNFSTTENTNVRTAMNPAGSMDTYRTKNVLAIVISLDPAVLGLSSGNKKVLSVWASTNRTL